MGMFDEIRCHYPLPLKGANDKVYQTKDTPAQFMDLYEIREDGTLWYEDYDIEDHSDPNAKGIKKLFGVLSKVNKRWKQVTITGEIRFYGFKRKDRGWIEWSAYFENGVIERLNLIENKNS